MRILVIAGSKPGFMPAILTNHKGETMKRYTFTNKLELLETVRRAIEQGITELHITDCSGDAAGYWLDMDMSCILTEQEQQRIVSFQDATA